MRRTGYRKPLIITAALALAGGSAFLAPLAANAAEQAPAYVAFVDIGTYGDYCIVHEDYSLNSGKHLELSTEKIYAGETYSDNDYHVRGAGEKVEPGYYELTDDCMVKSEHRYTASELNAMEFQPGEKRYFLIAQKDRIELFWNYKEPDSPEGYTGKFMRITYKPVAGQYYYRPEVVGPVTPDWLEGIFVGGPEYIVKPAEGPIKPVDGPDSTAIEPTKPAVIEECHTVFQKVTDSNEVVVKADPKCNKVIQAGYNNPSACASIQVASKVYDLNGEQTVRGIFTFPVYLNKEGQPLFEDYSFNHMRLKIQPKSGIENNISPVSPVAPLPIMLPVATDNQEQAEPEKIPGSNAEVTRLAGADRIETSLKIWEELKPKTAIIASTEGMADALAGGALAAAENSSVIFTKPNHLESQVAAALTGSALEKITILGGTSVVSEAVENQLKRAGITVERIAGADRFETAALVAARIIGDGGKVILARGDDYADALTAAPLAGKLKAAVLLVKNDRVPKATADFIAKHNNSLISIGGPAVAAAKSAGLKTEAIVGADRYATSVAVADYGFPNSTSYGVANGLTSADALASAGYLSHKGAPLLLVNKKAGQSVANRVSKAKNVYVFGGKAVVNQGVTK